MRILHLSTNDTGGGAARAAYRLHQGLCRLGQDSRMLVAQRRGDDPTVIALPPPAGPLASLRRRLRGWRIRHDMRPYLAGLPAGYEPFSDDRSRYAADLVAAIPPCDVINLHWVAGMLDYDAFFRAAPRRAPVVWRLSDQQPFSGGCHYDDGCGRHLAACGACPQLGSQRADDLSHQIWRRKRAALDAVPAGRLHIVALNRWIATEVRRSSLFGDLPVHVIPNGIDTAAFAPQDRDRARAELGIPPQARVILFVAISVSNRRKGFAQLAAALAGMADDPDLLLISIGRSPPQLDARIAHMPLGTVSDDARLALVYSAADLFVIPSLQDNMPSTVLESLACGTPVVGFDVGGVAELVRPGETGLLAPVGDVAGLREAMRRLLADADLRRHLGRRCRAVALAEYPQELQARRYLDLYRQIAAPGDPPAAIPPGR